MVQHKDTPPNFIDLKKPPKKPHQQLIQDVLQPKLKGHLGRRSIRVLGGSLIIIVIVGVLIIGLRSRQSSIVPASIRKSVNFTVYYPRPDHLPPGYRLDTSSFSSGNHAVLYVVRYGNNQKLVFTVQAKPSTAALQAFNSAVIPLHTTLTTRIGIATIGAARAETVISLPTKDKSWILITGPYQIPTKQLDQVLQAF